MSDESCAMSQAFPDYLVAVALEVETQDVFDREGIPVLFTGIGKVNAAYALTRRLAEYRTAQMPLPMVANFGTAGSQKHERGMLIACTRFIQRDMDVTGLGFAHGVTPFEAVPPQLEFPVIFDSLQQGICGSGDSFATSDTAHTCDVVDMEAYALAKVCWYEKTQFACAKYVTDGANHTAGDDWTTNLHKAAEAFLALYKLLTVRSA